jgi:DnaJ family protein C protein 8
MIMKALTTRQKHPTKSTMIQTIRRPLPEKIPDDSLSERDRERQRFIRRVLMLKNPFDVLGAEPEDSLDQLKKRFKKAALLIHPDKCSLPRTTDAFDKLGKAMKKLEDDDLRESFAQMIVKARRDMLADEKLAALPSEQQEAHRIELVNKALHRFEQHVTTAQKYRNANSKWEKQRKMEERERAKAQEEHEKQWDASRETRVDSWRSFVDAQ